MPRPLIIALIAGALCCGPASADLPAADRDEEARRIETFARAAKSVVCIYDKPTCEGGGSGVIIDPAGYGLTNFHVVAEMLETRRGYGGLSDGKLYPLRVLGIDPGGDIAMFKLEGRDDFDAAPLGDSDALQIGQWVAAMGNPFILSEDYTPTFTFGVISGLHRYQYGEGNLLEYADCIQVSTSINPGNSGGPLFDSNGCLIGINGRGSFEERGRVNVGLGYAVTINQIRRFLPGLRAGLKVDHGTLGVTVLETSGELIVQSIQQLSPAEKAGLRLADVLLTIDDRPLRTANEFNNAIAILPTGWSVKIKYRRGDQTFETTAQLEAIRAKLERAFVPETTDAESQPAPLGLTECTAQRPEFAGQAIAAAMSAAQHRVVKLYGSKIGMEKGYGSGVIVAPDGHILTVSSLLLEGQNLRAVLPDGGVYPANVVRRDTIRQLALLKIEGKDLKFFDLARSDHVQTGDWLISASNTFKVADGPEPVSVSLGILAGRINLAARRRAQDVAYEGPVLLTDVLVATPGAAGGALVDAAGQLVGLIGKPVISRTTNTWLNYGMPAEELAAFVRGEPLAATPPANLNSARSDELGIRLFEVGGRTRPAYVERVKPDSPAKRAGLRIDDLIVSANGQTVATCEDFRRIVAEIAANTPLALVVKRGDELATVTIAVSEGAP